MLSRDEVVDLERTARRDVGHEGSRVYFYDGINFWYCRGRMHPQQILPARTPRSGWRHHEGCLCGRCLA
jgi:hypothetical protein